MYFNSRDNTNTLEDEFGKLKTEHLSCTVERRRLERKLEVQNAELEDLKRELGFSKDSEAKAIKRYNRALEYNIEVEAKVAELRTIFQQERGQLLGQLSDLKDKLREKSGNLEAELASKRHVNDVKCSSNSRKRKELHTRFIGENKVLCGRKRKSPKYFQRYDGPYVSCDASNHSDNSSSDVGDHKQDAEQTKIQIYVETNWGLKLTMRVKPSLTIDDLKSMIEGKEGIPKDDQCLIFEGKRLAYGRTLADYDIQNKCIIDLTLHLRGG